MLFAEEFVARRVGRTETAEHATGARTAARHPRERQTLAESRRAPARQGSAAQGRGRGRGEAPAIPERAGERPAVGVRPCPAAIRRPPSTRSGEPGRGSCSRRSVSAIPPVAEEPVERRPPNVGGPWHDEAMRSPASSPSMIGRESDLEALRDELAGASPTGSRAPSSSAARRASARPGSLDEFRAEAAPAPRAHRQERRSRQRRRAVRAVHRHPPSAGRRHRRSTRCSRRRGRVRRALRPPPRARARPRACPRAPGRSGSTSSSPCCSRTSRATRRSSSIDRRHPLGRHRDARTGAVPHPHDRCAGASCCCSAIAATRCSAATRCAPICPSSTAPGAPPAGSSARLDRAQVAEPGRADPRLPGRLRDRRPRLPAERGRAVLRRGAHRHRPPRHRRRPPGDAARAAARPLRTAQRADAAHAAAHLGRRASASSTTCSLPCSTARPTSSTLRRVRRSSPTSSPPTRPSTRSGTRSCARRSTPTCCRGSARVSTRATRTRSRAAGGTGPPARSRTTGWPRTTSPGVHRHARGDGGGAPLLRVPGGGGHGRPRARTVGHGRRRRSDRRSQPHRTAVAHGLRAPQRGRQRARARAGERRARRDPDALAHACTRVCCATRRNTSRTSAGRVRSSCCRRRSQLRPDDPTTICAPSSSPRLAGRLMLEARYDEAIETATLGDRGGGRTTRAHRRCRSRTRSAARPASITATSKTVSPTSTRPANSPAATAGRSCATAVNASDVMNLLGRYDEAVRIAAGRGRTRREQRGVERTSGVMLVVEHRRAAPGPRAPRPRRGDARPRARSRSAARVSGCTCSA